MSSLLLVCYSLNFLSKLKRRRVSTEGLFHTCKYGKGGSKDSTGLGVHTQSRKPLLRESEGKFCLVVTMKTNQ